MTRNCGRRKKYLEAENVVFRPAVNEDLAATAIWGTQQTHLFEGAKVDGVFGLWYGKGPGVDRSGDVFKHANMAGTAPHGGVLVIAGDDHAAKSSTIAHQSEHALSGAQIPVLNPAGVDEVVDYGLLGIAMSRFSGLWVAMKAISETCDSGGTVLLDPLALQIVTPDDFPFPPDGVHIRWPDPPLAQEYRLMRHKIYAALAFARANRIDRVVFDSPTPRLGIVASGKAYKDVRQALADLGITERIAADIGIRLYKVGMPWPLERDGIRAFAEGLEEILVVEEKRALIENQLKEQLYNWRDDVRPRIVGKFDEAGTWILPSAGELTPAGVARAIAGQLRRFVTLDTMEQRLAWLERKDAELSHQTHRHQAAALLLLGLSSQHLDQGARGQRRAGRHRLPLHGHLDAGAEHPDLYPHGRRGRKLGRPVAVHRNTACVRQSGRRDVLPFRFAGDSSGGRIGRQHHLQDPL